MSTTRWATWAVAVWALSAALGYEFAGEADDTTRVQGWSFAGLRREGEQRSPAARSPQDFSRSRTRRYAEEKNPRATTRRASSCRPQQKDPRNSSQAGAAGQLRATPTALPQPVHRTIELDMPPLTVEAPQPPTVDIEMEPLVVEAPAPHVVDVDMEALLIEALPRSATRPNVAQN